MWRGGILGATVVALLRDEDPQSEFVRSGDEQRVTRVRGSLEDLALLERSLVQYEVDVVFHLGAQTQVRHAQRQPWATMEANVRGTYNLLEAVHRVAPQVRALVVASSDKAYGESLTLPYTEMHPLAGRNIYDASKSAADLLTSAYGTSFDLPVGIARCANIYGAGDLNWDRIVPGTIRSLLRGEAPIIRSDGTLQRDYLHVDDAVTAYLALGAALMDGRERSEAFNFGHGRPVSVLEGRRGGRRGRRADRPGADHQVRCAQRDPGPVAGRFESGRPPRLVARADARRGVEPDRSLVPGGPRVTRPGDRR